MSTIYTARNCWKVESRLFWCLYIIIAPTTGQLLLPEERTTGLKCIPEGRTVSYRCTATDPNNPPFGSTIWRGSAFNNCSRQISLPHDMFINNITEMCGELTVLSSGVSETKYTSELTLTATTKLNGKTILCIAGFDPIGNDTIKVGALLPPPENLSLTISDSAFFLSWSQPPDISIVDGYDFHTNGTCGGCTDSSLNSSTTSVTCSGWRASNQTCFFEVRAVSADCRLSGYPAKESIHLFVPSRPSSLSVTLRCSKNASVCIRFKGVTAPYLGVNINSSVYYMVNIFKGNFSEYFSGLLCDNASACTFSLNVSLLLGNGEYNVCVMAANILGTGPPICYKDCNPGVFGTDLALNQPKNALMVRISNGVVNYTGVSPGSIAILDCDEGYKPISGLNRSTCMFDGQWSEEILSCELTTDVSTMSSQSPYGTETSYPSSCVITIAIVVFVVMALLIILCTVLFTFIVFVYCKKGKDSKMQAVGNLFNEAQNSSTTGDTTSASHDQPGESTTSENSFEEVLKPQLDNYAQPKDLISKPCLPQQRYEGAQEKTVHEIDHGGREPAQYETIQDVRLSKPSTLHDQSSRELYSEVFDALPKGKSTKIVNKSTTKESA